MDEGKQERAVKRDAWRGLVVDHCGGRAHDYGGGGGSFCALLVDIKNDLPGGIGYNLQVQGCAGNHRRAHTTIHSERLNGASE
jgi:hypothetical protein